MKNEENLEKQEKQMWGGVSPNSDDMVNVMWLVGDDNDAANNEYMEKYDKYENLEKQEKQMWGGVSPNCRANKEWGRHPPLTVWLW